MKAIVGVIVGVIEGIIGVMLGTVGVELIGVRLDSVVAVAVGIGVVIPQADNCTASVKMRNKNGVRFEVFIAHPNSN